MAFKLFDYVRIIKKGVTGMVLDVFKDSAGKVWYVVESDQEGHRDDAVIKGRMANLLLQGWRNREHLKLFAVPICSQSESEHTKKRIWLI